MKKYIQGEQHFKSKLTDSQVELIRQMYDDGICGYRTIASNLGVSIETLYSLISYRTRTASAIHI